MASNTAQQLRYFAVDIFSSAAGWLLFCLLVGFDNYARGHMLSFVAVPVLVSALYAVIGSYNRDYAMRRSRADEMLKSLAVTLVASVFISLAILPAMEAPSMGKVFGTLVLIYVCLFVPMALARICILRYFRGKLKTGKYSARTLVAAYTPAAADRLRRLIDTRLSSGFEVVAIAGDGETCDDFPDIPYFCSGDIAGLCRRLDIHNVVLLQNDDDNHVAGLLTSLYCLGIPVYITPGLHNLMLSRPHLPSVVNEPLIEITGSRIPPATANLKRLGDIIFSTLALCATLPVMAVLGVLVKSSGPGPLLYTQERIGRRRKPFIMYKFRTMIPDAELAGPQLTSSDDPRVTRVGRFMRRYRLDELPQFWNVIRGDMSLVGPRPERDYFLRQMLEAAPATSLLFQVRPGITSWGMVKYGYATNVNQMIGRLYYDLLYLENVSLGTDLKILCHTVSIVLQGRGQ